ncbi:MAG: RES family NAD+ phosphorylase [Gammaproteobacteria bacterium]|jgi:hypothetical protein|nr:RES family NAD+ phosphorylase [Gammaproteobacteria bacterium]MBU0772881.1 RES family NAD+ phosphorylase [Gammaproteobacteria bacterium]MBU0854833.1 RES family NAD+ phosphorylase [Gammaproteobacteria bacterium]MBU1847623.1 RES family NAD+ phosphorylase [Gammaproteobacteria bacterium]
MDIWLAAQGARHIGPLKGTLLRMIEDQEQIATTRLVGALDKQQVLEDLLDATKPPWRDGTAHLHYLLATPFRYPPLRYGSRFGRRSEPALFYGALSLPTLLAEAAYYRFVFWHGMATPPARPLSTQHSVFEARYATALGVRLQHAPFDAWHASLTDPADYRTTQALGSAMREAGVAAFEYRSARDPARGANVALFSPGALAQPRPGFTEPWLAETSGRTVRYLAHGAQTIHEFPFEQFAVDGRLPQPAL